ncbi:DUF1302 domain-containing protein [Pseudomonas sp. BF-RE-26]|uniref:DUF1302 domain-containing protein n=1 Tax=Pseudomonas sp. BF-RE-26 TaxID=2832396 RepID=UPI001CBF9607|nr:DUF1302 domain-containing protein [Pseudomonas sp. BF-RE-26]
MARKTGSAYCGRYVKQTISVLACCGLPFAASAFQLNLDDPDWTARWDNTLRYNVGMRAQKQDQKILNNASYDDSDSKFDRGDVVTNRIDVLSEFDFKYKKRYGGRVSAAGWYDDAYRDTDVKSNSAFSVPGQGNTSTAYPNARYSSYTKRWNRGPSGELLDAFVFGRFDVGSVPVDGRLGRHNLYWGESIFSFVHGVSYSQGPVDLRKLATTPGIEAKELYLPQNQISGEAQLADNFSVGGQYFFEWDPSRLPDGGTYLGAVDFSSLGGNTYVVNPAAAGAIASGFGLPAGSIAPVPFLGVQDRPKNSGDWGVKATWRPEVLDGALGFYYREYTDRFPQYVLGGFQESGLPTDLRLSYLRKAKLVGVSLSKEVGGLSVGAEMVYRMDTGLLNGGSTLVGDEPRGDTFHALVNVLGLMPGNAAFDSASYVAELTYSRLQKVTSNKENFSGVGYGGCPTNDKWDGCATRDAWGLALAFTPTWYQVFPGIDLKAPLFLQTGLKGNSPVPFGGNQGAGSYSIGLTADVRSKYSVSLQYNGYLLKTKEGVVNGLPAVSSVNGVGNTFDDRGWVSLTLKTTF